MAACEPEPFYRRGRENLIETNEWVDWAGSSRVKFYADKTHPLSDRRFNLSTYRHLAIVDLASELAEKCALLFVICGMFITLF